ncbi:MAG: ATP-binding protein [Patescibacteria group bacterium]
MNFIQNFFKSSNVESSDIGGRGNNFALDELSKSVIETLRDGVIVYDRDSRVLAFNKAAEKIFNLNAEEIIGRSFSPNDIKEPKLKILIQTLFPSLAPVIVKHSESNVYPQVVDISFEEPKIEIRVATNKISDSKGGISGFVKIISDRTRELNIFKTKNEFISTAAHQLRTPLTAINWALETLVKESLSESQKQAAETGLQAASHLLKIVNDLLDVSKIEEGRYGYNFEKSNLVDFIESAIKKSEETSVPAGVKIYLKKPVELIEADIDVQKMEIALLNLLDNAIRYNVKNGEITVSVEKLKDKPYAQVSVKDTGIGISKEDVKKIFIKFFRAENAIKALPNGSGLGIYIVKNIIKRHGGDIWVESELNRGSVFYFTLPTDPKLIPVKEIADEEYV